MWLPAGPLGPKSSRETGTSAPVGGEYDRGARGHSGARSAMAAPQEVYREFHHPRTLKRLGIWAMSPVSLVTAVILLANAADGRSRRIWLKFLPPRARNAHPFQFPAKQTDRIRHTGEKSALSLLSGRR